MGTVGYLNQMINGGNTMVVFPRFEPKEYLDAIPKYNATTLGGAPQLYIPLVNHPDFDSYDLSGINLAASGAAPLALPVLDKMLEAFSGVVRVRPSGWGLEPGLRFRHATWGMETQTPGTGSMTTVALSLKNLIVGAPGGPMPEGPPPSLVRWEITAEWNREKAEPGAFEVDPVPDPGDEKDWWRVYFSVGI